MTKEEVINHLQSRINTIKMTNSQYKINKSYKKEIKALNMSIELWKNQKTGHWIDDEFGTRCSCCNIHTHLDKFGRPMRLLYCSFCGAKMEGENNELCRYNSCIGMGR